MRRIYWLPMLLMGTLWAYAVTGNSARAAQPCETLLPNTTKGLLASPDIDDLRAQWSSTDLGRLTDDPAMQPFIEDLRKQLDEKLTDTGVRLNIGWQDLEGVYGGEVCIATIQPEGRDTAHAVALIVDITDRRAEADLLLEKVERNLAAKGARKTVQTVDTVPMTIFTLPHRQEGLQVEQAVYFIHEEQLVATDHLGVAREILSHFSAQPGTDTLAQLPAFATIMQRCQGAAGDLEPHVRWFVEPFGYAEVMRAQAGGRKRRGTDLLKVLHNQGFAAIEGIGGLVTFNVDNLQLVHRTLVYAPPTGEDAAAQKYELAARMLAFPNVEQSGALAPQRWVPADVATYTSFQWKLRDAFEYSKSLVNELADAGDDDMFEDILDGIANDPLGPRVDLRKELVAHLGQRTTVLSGYKLPISPSSERLLLAVEVTNERAVTATVKKAMDAEPDKAERPFGDIIIWEILPREAEDVPSLQIDGPGFGGPFGQPQPAEAEEDGPQLPHSAITVANGHLIIASHVDFIVEVLKKTAEEPSLADTQAYGRVRAALQQLGMDTGSFMYFSRTDKANRATYELLRQGKMPESETLLGRVLNRFLAPAEEGVLRDQRIDGRKLPAYEEVERYFGPAGLFVGTEDDGWFIAGCLLSQAVTAQ